jgi:hypothetical protein
MLTSSRCTQRGVMNSGACVRRRKKRIHFGEQLTGGRKKKENIILQTAKLDIKEH